MEINITYERIVLSSIFTYPDLLKKANEKIFGNHDNQHIYKAMTELDEAGFDINYNIIVDKLQPASQVSLLEIQATKPVEDIKNYVAILRDNAIKREIQETLTSLKFEKQNGYELLEYVKDNIKRISDDTEFDTDFDKFGIENLADVDEVEQKVLLSTSIPVTENTVTIVTGQGGSGKSLLTIRMAIQYIRETNKKAFVWLSEDSASKSQERAYRIAREVLLMTDTEIELVFKKLYISSKTPFDIVQKTRDGLKVNQTFIEFKRAMSDFGFIVLDPLISFMGGLEENSNSESKALMKQIVDFSSNDKKTIVIIHHASKGSSGARGAGAIKDAVRLVYNVDFVDKHSKERLVSVEKDNNNVKELWNNKNQLIRII